MKNILINSLLAGVVMITVSLVFHFIKPSLNFNFMLSILTSLIIYLFFLIRAGLQQRKRLGGFIGFGEVFVSSIAIYTIVSFIAVTFSYILIKLNPELVEFMKESSNQMNESVMGMTGMSKEQIELAIEEANETVDPNQFNSISISLMGWLGGVIFPGLLYALIASLITKKKDKSLQ